MGTHDPIAYTYEADHHCPACAVARFGQEDGHAWPREDARDNEGNEVGAVAPWDEWANYGSGECDILSCGTCHAILDNAHEEDCREVGGTRECNIREEARA